MRFYLIAAMLLGSAVWPGSIQAQAPRDDKIKNPVDDSRDDKIRFAVDAGVFKDADPKRDYRHGRVVSFTSGNEDVTGIVVYTKGNKIYVRTEPGMPPKAYNMPKSAVKWVAYDGQKVARDVTYPEIQQVEFINGTKRTVKYIATTLSPSEEEELRKLQNAENEIAQLEFLTNKENVVLNAEIDSHATSVEAQKLFNTMLNRRINDPYWGRELNDPRWQRVLIADQDFNVIANNPYINGVSNGFIGVPAFNNTLNGLTTANGFTNFNGFNGFNGGFNGPFGFSGLNGFGNWNGYGNNWNQKAQGVNAYDMRGVFPTNNPPTPVPPPVIRPSAVGKELSSAQERLQTAHRNAVYEQGRLVAVIYVDPADKK